MDPRVRQLYKNLLFIGREYPQGYKFFRDKLHSGFIANANINNEDDLAKALAKGEFIYKVWVLEIETLLFLRTYRGLKKRYGYD